MNFTFRVRASGSKAGPPLAPRQQHAEYEEADRARQQSSAIDGILGIGQPAAEVKIRRVGPTFGGKKLSCFRSKGNVSS